MTEADDFLAQAEAQNRPEPKRNQWGQYVIPDPDTGQDTGWVRATTWCKTVAETFALEEWGKRCVALGLAARPDLLLGIKSIRDPEDQDAKKKLNAICDDAKEASGAAVRANIGTALHAFAEQQDMGLPADPGPEYRKDLDAYHAALASHSIVIRPEWMERVVIVPELKVAGTLDRLVEWAARPGMLTVLDLKTGRTMSYSWSEAIIQQVLYTRASHWVEYEKDGTVKELHEMPPVCQDRALIAHLPAGEGLCNVYELVDMDGAWRMASEVVPEVRAWRKRKDLAVLLVSPEDDPFADAANAADGATDVVAGAESLGDREAPGPGEGVSDSPAATQTEDDWDPFGQGPGVQEGAAPPAVDATVGDEAGEPSPAGGAPPDDQPSSVDRTLWLRGRLRAMRGNDKAMRAVAHYWPKDVPTKPPWTDAQVDQLATVVERAEAHAAMPFPEDRDPAKPVPERTSHVGDVPERTSTAPAEHDTKDGRKVAAARRDSLQQMARSMPTEHAAHVKRWLGEAKRAGCPFDIGGDELKERVYQVAVAALSCAKHLQPDEDTEPLTRAVLSFCWPVVNHPEPWDSSWTTGAAFGRLTKDAAEAVRDMAKAFHDGDEAAANHIGQAAVQDP